MAIKITYNQRQFVFEQLNKAFAHYKILNGKRIPDLYGPTTQALLREALHTYCFNYPLTPEVIEKEMGINSEKKKVVQTMYKFKIKIVLPIFGEKIELEQEIEQSVLEKR